MCISKKVVCIHFGYISLLHCMLFILSLDADFKLILFLFFVLLTKVVFMMCNAYVIGLR